MSRKESQGIIFTLPPAARTRDEFSASLADDNPDVKFFRIFLQSTSPPTGRLLPQQSGPSLPYRSPDKDALPPFKTFTPKKRPSPSPNKDALSSKRGPRLPEKGLLTTKRGPAQPKKGALLPKKNAVVAAAASNPEVAAAVPALSEGSESRFLLDKDFRYPLLKVIICR
jgi:hypothetical protein